MRFILTFGQRYRTEQHPVFEDADPDGYVEIEAPSYDHARMIANDRTGGAWAFLYQRHALAMDAAGAGNHWEDDFPLGQLAIWGTDDGTDDDDG